MSEYDEEQIIKWLVDLGIIEDLGYNEELGENMYHITSEAQEYFPQLKETHLKDINQHVFDLWQINMLDVTFDDKGEPLVALNKNSLDKEKIAQIQDPELKRQMIMIISAFDDYYGKDR